MNYLCPKCLSSYTERAKGDLRIVPEPMGGARDEICPCGIILGSGSGVPVDSTHWEKIMDGFDDDFDPPVKAEGPRTVYQNKDLRVILAGHDFIFDVARSDSMRDVAWEAKDRCRVEEDSVLSRLGRAVAQLVEEREALADIVNPETVEVQ